MPRRGQVLAATASSLSAIKRWPRERSRAPRYARRASQERSRLSRNLHATRHTFATRALRSELAGGWGMSLTGVQKMLGHSKSATTSEFYEHLVTDDIAAELLGVGV